MIPGIPEEAITIKAENMKADERQAKILKALRESRKPIPGSAFAEALHVSRQIIIKDIAAIRAAGKVIYATNRGYILQEAELATRVFKVCHSDEDLEKELTAIVDLGGAIEDVFVYHRVFGVIRGPLNIRTHQDIMQYMQNIASGKSKPLKNITSGYHYHTVTATSEEALDRIQERLRELGFLAKLQDYEPVDFWQKSDMTSKGTK